jgi:hypothetical protein
VFGRWFKTLFTLLIILFYAMGGGKWSKVGNGASLEDGRNPGGVQFKPTQFPNPISQTPFFVKPHIPISPFADYIPNNCVCQVSNPDILHIKNV